MFVINNPQCMTHGLVNCGQCRTQSVQNVPPPNPNYDAVQPKRPFFLSEVLAGQITARDGVTVMNRDRQPGCGPLGQPVWNWDQPNDSQPEQQAQPTTNTANEKKPTPLGQPEWNW